MNNELVEKFFDTLAERNRILRRKRSGQVPPWTDDHIFDRYRFCNVYRDADRCSQYFINNFLRGKSFDVTNIVWFAGLWHKTLIPEICEFFKREGMYEHGLPTYEEYDEDEFRKNNDYYSAVTGKVSFHSISLVGRAGRYGLIRKIHDSTETVVSGIGSKVCATDLITSMGDQGNITFYLYEWFLNIRQAYRLGLIDGDDRTFSVSEVPFVGPGTVEALKLLFPGDLDDTSGKGQTYRNSIPRLYAAAMRIYSVAEEYLAKYEGEKLYWDFVTDTWSGKFNLDFHNIEFWLCEFRKYLTLTGDVNGDKNREMYDYSKVSVGLFG